MTDPVVTDSARSDSAALDADDTVADPNPFLFAVDLTIIVTLVCLMA